jgi:hypothetical protein
MSDFEQAMSELLTLWRSGTRVKTAELKKLWKRAGIDSHFWPILLRTWRGRLSHE